MVYRQQQSEIDRAARVINARAAVERATQAYARGKATCADVNRANQEMADARYALSNPDAPVCTGRER
jgi:hypothetical protein